MGQGGSPGRGGPPGARLISRRQSCVETALVEAVLLGPALQPAIEQLRVDPPRLCLRDAIRWGFAYRGFPGGLAAVKQLEVSARWEGPGEVSMRSLLTPMRDDLQSHVSDEGRFESYLLHFSPPRKPPGEIRFTLRAVLADGREATAETSARYEGGCPPPACDAEAYRVMKERAAEERLAMPYQKVRPPERHFKQGAG